MVITYSYIGLFHYYVIITYYVINSHHYLLWTVKLADVDTVFKVGDRVLLRTKELRLLADIGKLRQRDGPFKFTVTTCQSPNAYTLVLPPKMRCSLP